MTTDTTTTQTKEVETMGKQIKWAVKYQTSSTHTGRIHRSRAAAERDLERCKRAARKGGDQQAITLVEV